MPRGADPCAQGLQADTCSRCAFKDFRFVETRPLMDRADRCAPIELSAGDMRFPSARTCLPFLGARGERCCLELLGSRSGGVSRSPETPSVGPEPCPSREFGAAATGRSTIIDHRLRRLKTLWERRSGGNPGAEALSGILAAHTYSRQGGPQQNKSESTGSLGGLQACYNGRAGGLTSQLPSNLGRIDQDFVKFDRDIGRSGGTPARIGVHATHAG
jgi:hypothetical protein